MSFIVILFDPEGPHSDKPDWIALSDSKLLDSKLLPKIETRVFDSFEEAEEVREAAEREFPGLIYNVAEIHNIG
jgi:hypothetical protein